MKKAKIVIMCVVGLAILLLCLHLAINTDWLALIQQMHGK